jgi:hypothetical protein
MYVTHRSVRIFACIFALLDVTQYANLHQSYTIERNKYQSLLLFTLLSQLAGKQILYSITSGLAGSAALVITWQTA